MPAFSKFPLSKPHWGVFKLQWLTPWVPVALHGLSSEYVPVLPFPEGIWKLLSHLGPEGETAVCTLKSQGKETRGKVGKPAGAEQGREREGVDKRTSWWGSEGGGWAEGRQPGAAG